MKNAFCAFIPESLVPSAVRSDIDQLDLTEASRVKALKSL